MLIAVGVVAVATPLGFVVQCPIVVAEGGCYGEFGGNRGGASTNGVVELWEYTTAPTEKR